MKLLLLKEQFAICNLNPAAALPAWLNYKGYGFVSRTPEELSIICSEEMAPEGAQTEKGWRCLKIDKPASSSVRKTRVDVVGHLSNSGIKSFTLSTYQADYLLFSGADLTNVRRVLQDHGYELD